MKAKTGAMWLVLVVFLLSTVLFVGPATTLAKDYKWRLNITNPSLDTTVGRAMQAFAKNIKDRTNGQLLIQVFPGGALAYNPFTVHRAVKEGALEMAETCMAYVSEEPVYKVYSQICLFSDAYEANKATDVAWTELQEAAKKHNQRILMTYSYPNDNLATVSKPMPKLESWKGEKIRAWNPFVAAWLKAIGAVPQVIPFNEKYTALAQHVIEGNFAAPRGMLDTGDYEVTKYYNLWGVTSPIYFVLVNLKQYEALPADVQKILLEEADKIRASVRKELAESVEGDLKILKEKHKMIIVDVPKEEFEKARAIAKSLWEDWAKDAGPEAKTVLAKVREALGY
jgi:TRAP-type C4-dicarboxylate transport system substrate-binding protein